MLKNTRLITLPIALIGMLIISACEITPKVAVTCPHVIPLEQASNLTRFLPGPGRDITDITIETKFNRISGDCDIRDDEVEVGVFIELLGTGGPALINKEAEVGLLMIVMTKDKKILQRREMPVVFKFPDNQSTVSYKERFIINIPKHEKQKGDDFLIYMAFKLTPEELKFNREEKTF